MTKKYGKLMKWSEAHSMAFKPLYSITGATNEIKYETALFFENKKDAVCSYFILRPKTNEGYLIDSGWHNNNTCVRESDGTIDDPF